MSHHRLQHNSSNPALHSPRLNGVHSGGVSRRPRANTEHSVRTRYHHSQPQHPYNSSRRLFDYANTHDSGAYTTSINYNNGNGNGWLVDGAVPPAVIQQHPNNSLNLNPFSDINMLEDRKPSLGINGSPHPPPTTLFPGPPASPSLSSRSRDSPFSLSYNHIGEYSAHSSSANSVTHSPPVSTDHSLPTVPSSSTDLSQHYYYGDYMSTNPSSTVPTIGSPNMTTAPQTAAEYDAVIANLRNQLREMEYHRRQDQARLAELQTGQDLSVEMTQDVDAPFKASWKARTESRIKTLCALNRAGNALCAWHDSRRERRQYPPRMAPAGVLNCGCTYEQALFEESLTRQGVGAYQPGESVRMDPALRNPLLDLLQRRYGYKDGDFERIRAEGADGEDTWTWPDNDDGKAWSTGKAQIGNTGSGRRPQH